MELVVGNDNESFPIDTAAHCWKRLADRACLEQPDVRGRTIRRRDAFPLWGVLNGCDPTPMA